MGSVRFFIVRPHHRGSERCIENQSESRFSLLLKFVGVGVKKIVDWVDVCAEHASLDERVLAQLP